MGILDKLLKREKNAGKQMFSIPNSLPVQKPTSIPIQKPSSIPVKKPTTIPVSKPVTKPVTKTPLFPTCDDSLINKIGSVTTNKLELDRKVLNLVKKRYIAFDVETTGLSAQRDKIIEIGAVVFENGKIIKRFGTLVNARVNIPAAATAVNHITNQMIQNAPSEKVVYEKLSAFLGDALHGKTIICAHNANFDMGFLSKALENWGYNGQINYIDTLSISRKTVKGLVNYKQDTIAAYFDFYNQNAHRAESDAEICGRILWELLKINAKLTLFVAD